MPMRQVWLMLLLFSLVCPVSLFAQDEDDFPPGLQARYSAGNKTIERVDPEIAFAWGTASPDQRLPSGPFDAEWKSQLLNRQSDAYRFHVYVEGAVTVTVDGQTILEGSANQPTWISSKPVQLSFGEKPLKVTYRKTGPSARLQLFWSSKSFRLEPVPSYLLFRESGDAALSRIERGRVLHDAHRCNRCHVRENDLPALAAPDLAHVTTGMRAGDLINKIQNADAAGGHARMPSFGFSETEARAIAAFLAKSAKSVALQKTPEEKTKKISKSRETRSGEVLFRSTGCLACHTVGKYGSNQPHSGGDLSNVGNKRSADWLNTWLSDPKKLNQDHRMPLFKLSGTERRRLVLYLSSNKTEKFRNLKISSDARMIATGKQLVEFARCAACHRIPGINEKIAVVTDLSQPITDWSGSCLAEKVDRKKNRPAYKQIDRAAIKAFVNSRAGELAPGGAETHGKLVLTRRNCLACHERGTSKGNVEIAGKMSRVDKALNGMSQALIPPALTAVGDKLKDDVLAEAISGEQKSVRLPWLKVRMPRFSHTAEDKAALQAYLIGHDRIPEGAPASGAIAQAKQKHDAQTLVVGQALVGAKGFSCIACHQIGSYTPKNIALGTRGSDLLMLGKRMRKSYYERWTAAPMRIVPGMEMPSLKKAVPGVLGDDINHQLTATWDALNDPRFQAPTNPTAVEQFFTIEANAPARIVRDVFTNPKENGGGNIPRSLAIGLNNGHNVLYDLDTFAVRQWTFGDFARQFTQGKSWFWDMAGIPVISGFERTSDFALLSKQNRKSIPILPKSENGTNGYLKRYQPHGMGAEFDYEINFEIDGKVEKLLIHEIVQPSSRATSQNGWQRTIDIKQIPAGFDLLVARPIAKNAIGSPTIESVNGSVGAWKEFANVPNQQYIRLKTTGHQSGVTLNYLADLKEEIVEQKSLVKTDPLKPEAVTTLPGYDGVRLPVSRAIMPTAFTWTHDGKMAFTSLKGHVYIAHDTDGDGVEDKLTIFEEGLASPYGILADGKDLIVSHKPELLRLRDTDGDGRADVREVIATGWGFNDNYHDWTSGLVRDSKGNMYVGLGSDYAQKTRPKEVSRWRGGILKISPDGVITSIASSFRYPMGLAFNANGDLFATDNQGVQNTFNEINHIVPGRHYGVPGRHEPNPDAKAYPPAIQVPHPWTRSVNAINFLPNHPDFAPFADHGIGCEYNGRLLVRYTIQQVDDVLQGAIYYFSQPNGPQGENNFVGPLAIAVSPKNEIYIGSIYDSGWLGGRNTGSITKLKQNGKFPNGIHELKATKDGFEIELIHKADRKAAGNLQNYTISGYTRKWQGGYATPEFDRHKVTVKSIDVSADGKTVTLHVDRMKKGYVYEVTCGRIGTDSKTDLWPATGHYTLHRIPR